MNPYAKWEFREDRFVLKYWLFAAHVGYDIRITDRGWTLRMYKPGYNKTESKFATMASPTAWSRVVWVPAAEAGFNIDRREMMMQDNWRQYMAKVLWTMRGYIKQARERGI